MTQQIKCYVTIDAVTMQAECAYLGIQRMTKDPQRDSLYQYKNLQCVFAIRGANRDDFQWWVKTVGHLFI